MIFANEWRGARGRYLDYFLYFRGLESEIGTLFHILVHQIVMIFAVYIVYNICKRMEGARGRYLDYFLHFWVLGSKRGNVKPSYLIEIHSEIATLFHIRVHHGPRPLSWLRLALLGLGSKRGNVKPSYLIKIHSEIATLFHIWSTTARIQARSLWNLLYI